MKKNKLKLTYLLRSHWGTLGLAFIAVIFESVTDLLDPWPLKIVIDYVIGSKAMSQKLATVVNTVAGPDKLQILNFAAISVFVIAAVGAVSSYGEKYLTTKVGQWVMHDLRKTLYHHIQRLSLAFYDQQKTGDLISRVTGDIDAVQDFVSQALLGILVNSLTLIGMLTVMFYLDWR
ncbi:MAG TPA: ABC transporter transmembrane domain-containing protein, partial [Acidobacteriota bacterium]|nr:ABC transporter transmembrane domain-containing protein [Acidobacteriota bacterium]